MTNRSLVLLSGEPTTLPEAEARAVFLAYDPQSKFQSPGKGVLIADSSAEPDAVGGRIAFSRRVGRLVSTRAEAAALVEGKAVKFRCFSLPGGGPAPDPVEYLDGLDLRVDLSNPDREITLVRGRQDYLAVSSPATMRQRWSERRPRARPFFHPSAIFPKLSRALVNLSRCKEGDVFIEPFAGTGSLAIEAGILGAKVVAWDQARDMPPGALSNMKHFGQKWLGVLRADAFHPPVSRADAMATDIPYGRVSSTRGQTSADISGRALAPLAGLLRKGSRIVMMHPQAMPLGTAEGLVVEEEHHLHVHKLLTRTITVLRRD